MKLMAIINATPDSFSDGGAYDPLEAGLRLVEQGADWVDVGGESTRPGAAPPGEEEELRRVIPVVRGLGARGANVSIDTRHARVAALAIEAGARLVNDVSGGEDPGMFPVVARAGLPMVIMHMRGTPATMRDHTDYVDLVSEVWSALAERRRQALAAGVPEVWIDPGIGFAKTAEQSLLLLRSLRGRDNHDVLVGASRKSFIGSITGQAVAAERVEGSLAVAIHCAQEGVGMLRVHDFIATRRALAMWAALA